MLDGVMVGLRVWHLAHGETTPGREKVPALHFHDPLKHLIASDHKFGPAFCRLIAGK